MSTVKRPVNTRRAGKTDNPEKTLRNSKQTTTKIQPIRTKLRNTAARHSAVATEARRVTTVTSR